LFSFHDSATSELSTLSLHDALPIFARRAYYYSNLLGVAPQRNLLCKNEVRARRNYSRKPLKRLCERSEFNDVVASVEPVIPNEQDRKSTRLNSSHVAISYAVFCLKK